MTDHKKALAASYHQAGKAAVAAYKAANTDAVGLKLRADVSAFKPRPRSMRDHAVKAVRLFLGDRSFLAMTNAQMAAHLSADEPGYTAPANILTEHFTAADRTRIAAMFIDKGVSQELAKLSSPSAVKLALRAQLAGAEADAQFTAEVRFTKSAVIVNGKAYPVSGDGQRQRVRVGEARLNLAALRKLIEG